MALVAAAATRANLDSPPARMAATAAWIQLVDLYIEGQATPAAIERNVRAVGQLDPSWTQPWFFGILMLPEEARAERQDLAERAAAQHPDVRWFSAQVRR